MKRNLAPEAKTAAASATATIIGGAITITLLLNSWLHWFTPPPADVVAGLTAAATALFGTVAGYFAPHTHLPPVIAGTVSMERTDGGQLTFTNPTTTTGGAS